MGSGSVTSLHEFYHARVINYREHVQAMCTQLAKEYEKLKEPILSNKPPDTLSVIRFVKIALLKELFDSIVT